ncbi:MAG: class I tRNA ligase family protein [Anaerolineales bacterium]|nr:class I tRNA ligase family protein [Anaerolineales bacterium]
MPFNEVPAKVDFPAQERQLLEFWRQSDAFNKMRQVHRGQPPWSFIDGPITANNPMGVHHGWGRTYKDLYQRFWTMRGRELRYQNGFDCQGLWVEVEVEREMGFKTKKDIEDFGLEQFVRKCKARVLRFAAVQTEQSIRLGYWMDWNDPDHLRWLAEQLMEDPACTITVPGPDGEVSGTVEQIVARLGMPELGGSYFTFSDENNYMIWTFLKKCWEKGWLYRGADVMPWCPRCATAISQHEIVTDGYAEISHPSVTLRFPLRTPDGSRRQEDGLPASLLVWTTTPWTLTSNVAAAVGPNLTYAKVRQGDEVFYLSKGTLHMLRGAYQVLEELQGKAMEGWTYDGPFDDLPAAQQVGGRIHLAELTKGITQSAAQAHRVLLWDEVGEDEGTGIVHIAPGCGAEDFVLGRANHLPLIAPLDDEGTVLEGFGWLSGMHVSEVAAPIFEDLERKGLLYNVEDYAHRYPTCWRCHTELVFRLVDEWFISMGAVYAKPRQELTPEEKARSLRYQIMDVVDQIRWIPDFGYSREMDWLHNMHDWMISKKRFWGLALPIWVCADCGQYEVIGDEAELQQRAVTGWETLAGHTPHRPFIDAVKLQCPHCQGEMSRIPDVGNPWLDAGIVSFSTLRYRRDRDYWRTWFPAHWISESFPGQFRNWFYSLLAMATVLENAAPFRQIFGYGTLLAEDGRPMHKSWGNSIEFNEAADRMGVDVMRWLYCAHKPENDLLFGYTRGDETRRRFLIPLWNVYSFLVTYARLDGWEPMGEFDPAFPEGSTPSSPSLLDRWALSRLNQVVKRVTAALEESDSLAATIALEAFLDDLTNWYVRRSRRRFWKSERDADKNTAYATLYHVLVKLVRLLAPLTPFVTESIYQNLVAAVRPGAYASVHHTSWPVADASCVDDALLEQMALARQVASLGLSARNGVGVKVRQPLARVLVYAGEQRTLLDELAEIVKDELNVKAFEFVEQASQLVTYKILPDNKLLGPRFGADFPKVRAALQAADPSSVAAKLQAGLPVVLEVDGQSVEIAPEEVLIQTQPVHGLAVAFDRQATVALDTAITPELRAEGLAREVVRRVQAMRKEAGFNIEDRIATYYQASAELSAILRDWSDYLKAETLSLELVPGAPPSGAYTEKHMLDGEELVLGVLQLKR